MTIYMDCCCLNRPFDDQLQDKIRIESDAVIAILSKCSLGVWRLVSSEVLDIEIASIPDSWKKGKVLELYKLASEKIALNDKIKQRAREIQAYGLKAFDSLHVASAEYKGVDVFLTTDKNLLKAAQRFELPIKVVNPLNWFMEVADDGQ